MSWKKRGMIFNAEQHGLYYAKSPQAVAFEDYARVYFSTCERDGEKLISQVSYADFNYDFQKCLKVSDHYVINRGNLGCYDEHGIFPFSPVNTGAEIYAYLSGWTRRISVSADAGIGLAVSTDGGEHFQRLGDGPVLTASLHEPLLVADGFVRKIREEYHMWYIYGSRWITGGQEQTEPQRVYKIAHAVSEDGIVWVKEGRSIIPDVIGRDECQALPTVTEQNGMYHMLFCYRNAVNFRHNRNNAYRIGYAYSDDLKTWRRDDRKAGITVSDRETDWDYEMQCYPHIFQWNNKIYLLYNGNEFGKYGFGLAEWEE